MPTKTEITVSWGTLWRLLVMTAFVAAVIYAKDAVLMLFSAIVISSAIDSPVAYLKDRFKIPRILGTLLIFSVIVLFAAFLIYIILPVIVLEITTLAASLRGTTAGTVFGDVAKFINIGAGKLTLSNLGQITDLIFKGTSPVFQTIGSIFSGLAFFGSALIIAFYLTLTRDGVGRFLRAVLPDETEDWIIAVYYRSKKKIALWLQAQLLLSLIVGTLVSASLWILGVKYSLVIGILAAIFEIMPVVGPIFSGAVGTLIAASGSVTLGVYTLLVFVAIQQIENNLLVPVIMGKVVDIHPVSALFSLIAGYQLFGVVGMVLSVPVAVIIQDVIEERIERRAIRLQKKETSDEKKEATEQ